MMISTTPRTIATNRPRYATILALVCFTLGALSADAAIIPRLKSGESLKIAAIGTSLSAPDWSSWFSQVGTWLNSQYYHKVTLDNEAIPATYSDSGINVQLPETLANNPDAVFIEFSVNDSCNISLQQSCDNLQTMINQINASASTRHTTIDIVVQTMNNVPGSTRPELASFYQGYRNVAAANHLLLIDNEPNWVNLYNTNPSRWATYVPDGVHPSPSGSLNVIFPEIQRALNSQTPEPSTLAMLVAGLLCLATYAWRKRRQRVIMD